MTNNNIIDSSKKNMSNENKKIIHKCIYNNFYERIENNVRDGKVSYIDRNLLKIIKLKNDRIIIIKYMKYIYDLYTEYLYEILFNYYDMDGPESGEIRTVKYFKKN